MSLLRNFDLVTLAYVSGEITETILVPHLSAGVTKYTLPEPTKTLGHKLAVHRTRYAEEPHCAGLFSHQTAVRGRNLVEPHQGIKLSRHDVPAMVIRLAQSLRLNSRHHDQIRLVQTLTRLFPQPYEEFVILTPGEFRRKQTDS